MKKLAILIAVAVMITIAIPAFSADQWELGLSWTPIPGEEQSARRRMREKWIPLQDSTSVISGGI